jgi:hypothetical protein
MREVSLRFEEGRLVLRAWRDSRTHAINYDVLWTDDALEKIEHSASRYDGWTGWDHGHKRRVEP